MNTRNMAKLNGNTNVGKPYTISLASTKTDFVGKGLGNNSSDLNYVNQVQIFFITLHYDG